MEAQNNIVSENIYASGKVLTFTRAASPTGDLSVGSGYYQWIPGVPSRRKSKVSSFSKNQREAR